MLELRSYLNQLVSSGKVDDKQQIGIGHFTLEARVREAVTLSADVPGITLEDGSKAHDHIILNPIQVDIEGEVGDIAIKKESFTETIRKKNQVAESISPYPEPWTEAQKAKINALALTARDAAIMADRIVKSGENISNIINPINDPTIPISQQFINQMQAYFYSKQPFELELYGSGETLSNMFMTSFVTTFDNKTNGLTYKMSLIQIRYIKTVLKAIAPNPRDDMKNQVAPVQEMGELKGTKVSDEEKSILMGLIK